MMNNIKMCDVDKLAELVQVHKVEIELWVIDERGASESVDIKPWQADNN